MKAMVEGLKVEVSMGREFKKLSEAEDDERLTSSC